MNAQENKILRDILLDAIHDLEARGLSKKEIYDMKWFGSLLSLRSRKPHKPKIKYS